MFVYWKQRWGILYSHSSWSVGTSYKPHSAGNEDRTLFLFSINK